MLAYPRDWLCSHSFRMRNFKIILNSRQEKGSQGTLTLNSGFFPPPHQDERQSAFDESIIKKIMDASTLSCDNSWFSPLQKTCPHNQMFILYCLLFIRVRVYSVCGFRFRYKNKKRQVQNSKVGKPHSLLLPHFDIDKDTCPWQLESTKVCKAVNPSISKSVHRN